MDAQFVESMFCTPLRCHLKDLMLDFLECRLVATRTLRLYVDLSVDVI